MFLGLVTDLRDPDGLGRVKVKLPWAPDAGGGQYEAWARLATLMGGNNRGSWFVPDVDDEVLRRLRGRRPAAAVRRSAALWNGTDTPPESMDGAGRNTTKVIRSRNGVKLTLDDTRRQEQLRRRDARRPEGHAEGRARRRSRSSTPTATRSSSRPAASPSNASAKVTVQAAQVEVSAGMVTVDAGMSKFSGVVKADTVITNSVVSASYTPGAGNIW